MLEGLAEIQPKGLAFHGDREARPVRHGREPGRVAMVGVEDPGDEGRGRRQRAPLGQRTARPDMAVPDREQGLHLVLAREREPLLDEDPLRVDAGRRWEIGGLSRGSTRSAGLMPLRRIARALRAHLQLAEVRHHHAGAVRGERRPLPGPVHADDQPEARGPDRLDSGERILHAQGAPRRDAQKLRRVQEGVG